jgi:hypothetical protein
MTAIRRSLLFGVSALLLLSLPVGGAVAADLDDVLTDAQDSTYTASRLIVSVWGGQTQVTREFVEHADGMEMVRRDADWSLTGHGKAASMGEVPAGVSFLTKQASVPSTRYTIEERAKVDHMSRPCRIVDVMEGDVLRASLVVDDRSGALLIQEQFSGNGELFRRTTLSDFRAYRTYEAPMEENEVPMEVVMPEDSALLPEAAAGYELVDAFSAPGGSEQGYFSDGLFRFSLFVLNGRTVVTGFEEPMAFVTGDGVYDMVATSQAVRLHWQDGSNNYVLVGDVPPDHLRDILADLPAPNSDGMWGRWWQRLFG